MAVHLADKVVSYVGILKPLLLTKTKELAKYGEFMPPLIAKQTMKFCGGLFNSVFI